MLNLKKDKRIERQNMKKANKNTTSTSIIPEFIPVVTSIPEFIPVVETDTFNEAEYLMNADPLILLNARKQMYVDLGQKLMNKIEVINHIAKTHTAYLTNKPIEERIQQITNAMQAIGNTITRTQAIQMLTPEQKLQLQPATTTTARTRVKGSGDGVLKLNEVNAAVIAYHCSWGKLPQAVKDNLDENDPKNANQTRYSQLQGYFNSILGKGDSYYKHLCTTGLDLTMPVVHSELPKEIKDQMGNVIAVRPDSSATTLRFIESLALVKEAGLI